MGFVETDKEKKRELVAGVTVTTSWGDKIMLSIVEMRAGAVVPDHEHPHEQAGMAWIGEFDMIIGGERRRLKPGDKYIIPGGVRHSAEAVAGPVKIVDIFSPPREDYK